MIQHSPHKCYVFLYKVATQLQFLSQCTSLCVFLSFFFLFVVHGLIDIDLEANILVDASGAITSITNFKL